MVEAMLILVTNDDGIEAPGLLALVRAASHLGELVVVAPSKVRSACGHAVTFHRQLEVWRREVTDEDGGTISQGFAVSGTPADCVKVALARLLPRRPDLVLSGINAGCNVGIHTLYSGTVAAAREAAINGIPAVSMSLFLRGREEIAWDRASKVAADVLDAIVTEPLAAGLCLNVNIPVLDDGFMPRGIRVAPTNWSPMVDDYRGEPDAAGHMALTVGEHVSFGEVHSGTDTELLFEGWVTVTPMKFDPTEHDALELWRRRLES